MKIARLLVSASVLAACASGARAGVALGSLEETERASAAAAARPRADAAREEAGLTLDGGVVRPPGDIPPKAERRIAEVAALDPAPVDPAPRPARAIPPARAQPASGPLDFMKRIPPWAVYAGSAVLGGVQGYLSAGLFGAAGGVILGLGAASLYQNGHHAAAFGWTLGGIVGGFLGGPIGALAGAVLGALVGHLVGSLFK
jgi:hypothetical protein